MFSECNHHKWTFQTNWWFYFIFLKMDLIFLYHYFHFLRMFWDVIIIQIYMYIQIFSLDFHLYKAFFIFPHILFFLVLKAFSSPSFISFIYSTHFYHSLFFSSPKIIILLSFSFIYSCFTIVSFFFIALKFFSFSPFLFPFIYSVHLVCDLSLALNFFFLLFWYDLALIYRYFLSSLSSSFLFSFSLLPSSY